MAAVRRDGAAIVGRGSRNAVAVAATVPHDAPAVRDPLPLLRIVAIVEAISYLVLVGVAMPLKYAWGDPRAVKVFGMLHGVLFLMMVWLLMRAHFEASWSKRRVALVFVASLVPVWPFLLDRRVREWIAEPRAS